MKYDAGIFSAAVADYIPLTSAQGKIPSGGALTAIPLQQTAKVIREVRDAFPELPMVTFKYECGITKEALLAIANKRIGEGYQFVVANRGEDMIQSHRAYIVGPQGVIAEPESREAIAHSLMDVLGAYLTGLPEKK